MKNQPGEFRWDLGALVSVAGFVQLWILTINNNIVFAAALSCAGARNSLEI